MHFYQCSGHIFTVAQRKVSVTKHRCLFSFHTQLILLAGVRAGLRAETGELLRLQTFTLWFLHTVAVLAHKCDR